MSTPQSTPPAEPAPHEAAVLTTERDGRILVLTISRPEDSAAFAYMLVRDEFFETGQIWNYSGGNSLLGHPRFLA